MTAMSSSLCFKGEKVPVPKDGNPSPSAAVAFLAIPQGSSQGFLWETPERQATHVVYARPPSGTIIID